jgi:predicted Zn-dependent protease
MKKILTLLVLLNTVAFAQQKELQLTSDALGYDVDYYENLEKRLNDIKEQSIDKARTTRLAALSNSVNTSVFETNQLRNGTNIYTKNGLEIIESIVASISAKNPTYGLENVHTFISRSSAVNAYATDNGNIWVTLGLLARIENEAQLAFILCHEAAHFIKKHSYEKVVNASEKALTGNSDELQIHDYSREKELEADSLGLILFQNLGYSNQAIPQVFDLLARCQLSIQKNDANKSYPFTTIVFDSAIAIGKSFDQNLIENDDDKQSTHPSIGLRRKTITRMLENGSKSHADKLYIHGNQEQYFTLRNQARYTLSDIYLTENNYLSAITNNEFLLAKYPEDTYLKYNLMMGWINAAHQIKTLNIRSDTDYLFERNFDVYELIYQTNTNTLFTNLLVCADALYEQDRENKDYLHAYKTAIALFSSHFKNATLDSKKKLIEELAKPKRGDNNITEIATILEEKLNDKVVSDLLNP